ncbi:hypothetical protein CI109_105351 [Kwoniella shandongensis]|uniref:Uncharacterized protein n=1 Tax=Kwoniella shandongensis TaxID=1734106 RepID=A0A5M6BUP8_9TREE|nr:uncharacterized protein CI109_006936 [Kwoniella shandongensis]KAA5524729.1 hypothetical protein CI109_006936 [Kwoniella shandongensis]
MFSLSSLTLLLPLLSLDLVRAEPKPRPHHSHNLNNPHRRALKRSITNDASSVNGMSFDFVIAGGGVAGLTLAARLSEWSNVTVLCIEAGGDGTDVEDKIDIPGYSYLNSLTGSAYDWAYTTTPQSDSLNISYHWPRGKGLGGSGAINGLFFGRGSSIEYDAWATLNPNAEETWDWNEVNKYIKKAENFTAPPDDVLQKLGMVVNASAHGTDGPIQAGYSQYIYDENAKWIPAWNSLGLPAQDTASGSTRGATLSTSTLNSSNQTRSDSKAGYIDPLPPRSNLVILTGQQVTGIIFNGSTDASGNVIASGLKFQANAQAESYSVQANLEVILAGGTVGSPQILQLSGIGPKDILSNLGIASKVDLPVGYNLQDHVSYSMYWTTPEGTLTWNNLSASTDLQQSELAKYKQSRTGMWTYINEAVGYPSMADITSDTEAASYATTVNSQIDQQVTQVTSWQNLPANVATGLKAQYKIQQEWLTSDVGQLEIILTLLGKGGNQLGIQVALQHPFSRGTIMIASTNAFEEPLINPDYFGVGYDIDIMGYGSAFARRLAAASPLNQVMITEQFPGATVVDDALATYTKTNCGTEYHPLGTCSMLPKDSGGVVDTTLTVYGTANLRVIDASIMPLQLSAHLMASSYGIAEKGADIIKKKHQKVIAAAVTPNSTTNAGSQQQTTASAGKATDTAITGANNNLASQSTLSTGAKAGIGAGVGAGVAVILAGLLAFFCLRRKKSKAAATEKGWYNNRPAGQGWNDGVGGSEYKEAAAGSYPMAAFDSHATEPLQGPHASGSAAPWAHSRTQSVNTIATADLASRTPMRSGSAYGLSGNTSGTGTPYRDDGSDDGHSYPAPEGGQPGWPREQRYHPVQIG